MSKLYDLLGSMIFKIKETEGAIPKKVSQLEQDVKVNWDNIEGKPNFSGGGGGGGVSGPVSWNDLTDRPFGEETTPEQTITYDGSLDGYEYVEAQPGQYYVKLSDITPEPEVFIGTTTKLYTNGEIQEVHISSDSIHDMDGVYIIGAAFILVPVSGAWNLSAGIWGISQIVDGEAMAYSAELTIPGTTIIHKIDPKYLPETQDLTVTITEKFRIEYNGNPDGREKTETNENVYLKVSDEYVEREAWVGGTITATSISGNVATIQVTEDLIATISTKEYAIANTFMVRESGVWVIFPIDMYETTKNHTLVFEGLQETTVTKIDPKFIPDSVLMESEMGKIVDAVIDALPTAEGGSF